MLHNSLRKTLYHSRAFSTLKIQPKTALDPAEVIKFGTFYVSIAIY